MYPPLLFLWVKIKTVPYFKALKFIKFDFGWRLCPRPSWGSLQHSPDHIARFKGTYFYFYKGREGRERGIEMNKGEGNQSGSIPPKWRI